MKPRVNVITLAVADLGRSIAFYRDGLGFPCEGVFGSEFEGSETEPAGAIGYFELENGLIFIVYPRKDLAKDSKLPAGEPTSTEFSLGYLASSVEEVDQIISKAKAAGATIPDEPHERPWGIYSGYFADPDGHLWEIIFNPRSS